jgi:serine/threonine-protein phosphatase 2A activator
MQPTAAPWAKRPDASAEPLPAVSRGETTSAPWAGGRVPPPPPDRAPPPLVRAAEPRWPPAIPDIATHAFRPAAKCVDGPPALRRFLESEPAAAFLSFLLALGAAARGRPLSAPVAASPAVQSLVALLDELDAWVDEVPPARHSVRYGNPAYREWHARLAARAPGLLAAALPPGALRGRAALAELAPYLADAFGNATRIDYGTGHEAAFAALLFCLARAGAFTESDAPALALRALPRYLALARRLQTTYWLEPAGSHGVWGLDDYQFLPFLVGAAQLEGHAWLRPRDTVNAEVLAAHADDYLYLGAVAFVRRVKKGPLGETSPTLCDVAAVPGWAKVAAGLAKMFQAEVLGKVPIMQHFLFGSLLPFPEDAAAEGRSGHDGAAGGDGGGGEGAFMMRGRGPRPAPVPGAAWPSPSAEAGPG